MNRTLGTIVRVSITAALLGIILLEVDLPEVWKHLKQTNPGWYALGLTAAFASVGVNVYRWQVLLSMLGHKRPYRQLVRLYLYGVFFNLVLPTSIGGDAVRAYYTSRETARDQPIGLADAVASIFAQRLTGFAALVTFAILFFFLGGTAIGDRRVRALAAVVIAGFSATFILVAAVSFSQRMMNRLTAWLAWIKLASVGNKLGRVADAVRRYRGQRRLFVRVFTVAFVFQATVCLSVFCLGRSLGLTDPVWYYFLSVPLITIVMMGPSLGGHGLREGGYVVLFPTAGLSLSLLFLSCTALAGLIGGVVFARGGGRKSEIQSWAKEHEYEFNGGEDPGDDK